MSTYINLLDDDCSTRPKSHYVDVIPKIVTKKINK